ncbi:carbohydrate esterase family 5 protein [Pochonia chlamydosporia 170]|uniref:cutinase n=1 Tax=Pochonia chlamydosporia 170 TaxID=1380566 RepID=A0A179FGV6_METCM|nr:carbohydrate esterase family 5 protein [Pochonia chlamydosporia 170]OAQ64578.1 carbohydrate esterase family 5 protein [Pochonia chlamydosporia 170]
MARNGHNVGRLLSWGADANARDKKGYTPIIIATREIREMSVLRLFGNGVDLSPSSSGETPLQFAYESYRRHQKHPNHDCSDRILTQIYRATVYGDYGNNIHHRTEPILDPDSMADGDAEVLKNLPLNDTADDWNSHNCADLAVIFARGTFDSGNIGPWVGQPFHEALIEKFGDGKVAFQGVNPHDYLANLKGYIEDGGPESCAISLRHAVEEYSSRCRSSKIVISGWSQGALCAHKSVNLRDVPVRARIIALVTFGDPVSIWQDTINFPALPGNTKMLSYCETTTPDPLCTNLIDQFPHDPIKFIEKLKAIWNNFSRSNLNQVQKAAVNNLVKDLTKQAAGEIGKLGKDILAGHIRRWMLTPQHFLYGLGPSSMVRQAAEDVFALYSSLE